jgi:hypothetical protein
MWTKLMYNKSFTAKKYLRMGHYKWMDIKNIINNNLIIVELYQLIASIAFTYLDINNTGKVVFCIQR